MNDKFKRVVAGTVAAATIGTGGFIAGKKYTEKHIPRDFNYTIQSGDTLYTISDKFYGSIVFYDDIAEYNGIEKIDDIKAGEIIKIPNDLENEVQYGGEYEPVVETEQTRTYIVAKDDNLIKICEKMYGVPSYELALRLADVNGIDEPNLIREGQELTIPPKDEIMNMGIKK